MTQYIPQWLDSFFVTDASFGEAYGTVPDTQRALLKTHIARLWAAARPEHTVSVSCQKVAADGWTFQEKHSPLDWALIVCDDALDSPACLLAAVMPAIAAGVRTLLVARVGDAWPASLLVALELAGVEQVVAVDKAALNTLICDLEETKSASQIIQLGDFPIETSLGRRPIVLPLPTCGLVVGDAIDPAALRFAHPSLPLITCDNLSFSKDSFSSVLSSSTAWGTIDADVIFASQEFISQAQELFPLTLGAGCEASWVWPQLCVSFFMQSSLSWATRTLP